MDQDCLFSCIDCERQYNGRTAPLYLCPFCSSGQIPGTPPRGLLKTLYDYESIRKKIQGFACLKKEKFAALLPIQDTRSLPPLRIGQTPLYPVRQLDGQGLPFHLFVKDDSQNPSFSYKDRASALVSAFAREMGHETIVAASTGNAGSSLACICASQQQHAVIMVPEKAPLAKISQVMMYGAHLIPVKGNYDQAFDLSISLTEEFGWYNRNTAYNPLTTEGKKTAAWELYEQMAGQDINRIYVPVGDGVIISGIYKGFEDLMQVGLLEEMPVIVAVQSEGSDNLVRNIRSDSFMVRESNTMADSISVDVPRNFRMARNYLLKYKGEGLSVSDTDILSAAAVLARNTGVFAEPAAAAAFAGLLRDHRKGNIESGSNVVVLSTGSGLKDIRAMEKHLTMPEAVEPELQQLKKALSRDKGSAALS